MAQSAYRTVSTHIDGSCNRCPALRAGRIWRPQGLSDGLRQDSTVPSEGQFQSNESVVSTGMHSEIRWGPCTGFAERAAKTRRTMGAEPIWNLLVHSSHRYCHRPFFRGSGIVYVPLFRDSFPGGCLLSRRIQSDKNLGDSWPCQSRFRRCWRSKNTGKLCSQSICRCSGT